MRIRRGLDRTGLIKMDSKSLNKTDAKRVVEEDE